MSGITYIKRVDNGASNNLVYLETTNTTAAATAANYIFNQLANITAANNGVWTWEPDDCIMLSASDGISWCSINAAFTTLAAFSGFGAGDVTYTSPSIANHIASFTNTSGNISQDVATAINGGNIQAGLSGTAGYLASFPATASKGSLHLTGVANTGNTVTTISNAAMGQASVVSIPDPGAATANFLLDTGTGASISINNLKYGATPVAQVDPGSCTITAAAGASNTCTITVQLNDGSGTNMTRALPFKVYLATDATGLTLQTAASTGYSVASGGVKDPTGSTTITQGLAAFSSASGGCVLSLLDTGKGTGNLILMLPNGFKASAAITSGSYG